ncbi:hypothetical protein ACFX15_010584 [Malus domestica]
MRERVSSSRKGSPSSHLSSADKYQPEGESVPNKFSRNGRGKKEQSQSVAYRGSECNEKSRRSLYLIRKSSRLNRKVSRMPIFSMPLLSVFSNLTEETRHLITGSKCEEARNHCDSEFLMPQSKRGGTVDDSETVKGPVLDKNASHAAGGPTKMEKMMKLL